MAKEQTLFPLALSKPLNMSAVQMDIEPWDNQDQILFNTGINREQGVTNLTKKIALDSAYEETYYCTNGSKVQLARDTINKRFNVYADGRDIGHVPLWGVKSRQIIPGNCADVQCTVDGTLLLLYFSPSLATIEEIDPATGEQLNIRSFTIPSALTQIWFVRYKQPTYANVTSICGYSHSSNPLADTAQIIKDDGTFSSAISILNVLPENKTSIYFVCHYEHGWILEIDTTPQGYRAISVFLFKTDLTYTTPAGAVGSTYGLVAKYNESTDSIEYYTIAECYATGGWFPNYGFKFTPPTIDGGSWVVALLPSADFIANPNEQVITYGGSVIRVRTPQNDVLFFNHSVITKWADTYATDLPEIYGNIYPGFNDIAFKMHTISGINAYLSISFDIDGIGATVTEIGEISAGYCPHILRIDVDNYFISYQRGDGKFGLITVSQEEYDRMQEITSGVVKINCASGLNVADTVEKDLKMGGNAFNGFMIPYFSAATADGWASKIRSVYGGSIDIGYKNAGGSGAGYIRGAEIKEKKQFTPNNESIDIYFGDLPSSLLYAFSIIAGGGTAFLTEKSNTLYVDDQVLPIPAGADISDRAAKLIATTALREADYDGYQLGNEVKGLFDSFILYSQIYFVDTEWIRAIGVNGTVLVSANKIAPIQGLQFIASSPTEAYFHSAFDNSLYTFSGGQSVEKQAIFNRLNPIRGGAYSVYENTLVLVTDTTVIFIRDGISSENLFPFSCAPALFVTERGVWLSCDGYAVRYIFDPAIEALPIVDTIDGGLWGTSYTDDLDGGAWGTWYDTLDGGTWGDGAGQVEPLTWQSKFLGFSDRQVQMIDRFLFRVYKEDAAIAYVYITMEWFAENEVYSETRTYTLGDVANPYDSSNYAYFEFVPSAKRSIAASIKFECYEKIHLLSVFAKLLPDGETSVTNR